jgi:hypothetical protein
MRKIFFLIHLVIIFIPLALASGNCVTLDETFEFQTKETSENQHYILVEEITQGEYECLEGSYFGNDGGLLFEFEGPYNLEVGAANVENHIGGLSSNVELEFVEETEIYIGFNEEDYIYHTAEPAEKISFQDKGVILEINEGHQFNFGDYFEVGNTELEPYTIIYSQSTKTSFPNIDEKFLGTVLITLPQSGLVVVQKKEGYVLILNEYYTYSLKEGDKINFIDEKQILDLAYVDSDDDLEDDSDIYRFVALKEESEDVRSIVSYRTYGVYANKGVSMETWSPLSQGSVKNPGEALYKIEFYSEENDKAVFLKIPATDLEDSFFKTFIDLQKEDKIYLSDFDTAELVINKEIIEFTYLPIKYVVNLNDPERNNFNFCGFTLVEEGVEDLLGEGTEIQVLVGIDGDLAGACATNNCVFNQNLEKEGEVDIWCGTNSATIKLGGDTLFSNVNFEVTETGIGEWTCGDYCEIGININDYTLSDIDDFEKLVINDLEETISLEASSFKIGMDEFFTLGKPIHFVVGSLMAYSNHLVYVTHNDRTLSLQVNSIGSRMLGDIEYKYRLDLDPTELLHVDCCGQESRSCGKVHGESLTFCGCELNTIITPLDKELIKLGPTKKSCKLTTSTGEEIVYSNEDNTVGRAKENVIPALDQRAEGKPFACGGCVANTASVYQICVPKYPDYRKISNGEPKLLLEGGNSFCPDQYSRKSKSGIKGMLSNGVFLGENLEGVSICKDTDNLYCNSERLEFKNAVTEVSQKHLLMATPKERYGTMLGVDGDEVWISRPSCIIGEDMCIRGDVFSCQSSPFEGDNGEIGVLMMTRCDWGSDCDQETKSCGGFTSDDFEEYKDRVLG